MIKNPNPPSSLVITDLGFNFPWASVLLVLEIAPVATKMVKFGPKKAYLSTGTLNIPNELCFGT